MNGALSGVRVVHSGTVSTLRGGAMPPSCNVIEIDLVADDGSTCRYCLAEWVQGGPSAVYTFLYVV